MEHHTNSVGEKIFYTGCADSFFEINMCGYTPANPKYEVRRYKSNFYTLEYVISGIGYIDSDKGRTTVSAGDFYLLRSGFTGHYYPDSGDSFSKLWINASGSLADRLCDTFGIGGSVTVLPCTDDRIYSDLRSICELFAACKEDELSEAQRKSSIIFTDILSIVRASSSKKNEPRSAALRIHDYLELHLCDEVTLSMIADAMYMHEVTVIRVFKEHYGITPMKYLTSMRIEAAKRMLLEGISVKSVSEMLRFTDPSYFALCFKKETNLSPIRYISSFSEKNADKKASPNNGDA